MQASRRGFIGGLAAFVGAMGAARPARPAAAKALGFTDIRLGQRLVVHQNGPHGRQDLAFTVTSLHLIPEAWGLVVSGECDPARPNTMKHTLALNLKDCTILPDGSISWAPWGRA